MLFVLLRIVQLARISKSQGSLMGGHTAKTQLKYNASKCMQVQIEDSGQVNRCDHKPKYYLSSWYPVLVKVSKSQGSLMGGHTAQRL